MNTIIQVFTKTSHTQRHRKLDWFTQKMSRICCTEVNRCFYQQHVSYMSSIYQFMKL